VSTALFHAPLSAPAEFVGTVDATRERATPCPRTLHQAFGEHADHCHIVPMDTPIRTHPHDVIVGWACAFGGVFLTGLLIAEKAGWL
jgi:hypothetical protein